MRNLFNRCNWIIILYKLHESHQNFLIILNNMLQKFILNLKKYSLALFGYLNKNFTNNY